MLHGKTCSFLNLPTGKRFVGKDQFSGKNDNVEVFNTLQLYIMKQAS